MTPRGNEAAALALHRFGFGPVRDQIAAIAGDPRGAILADLEHSPAGGVAAADLPSSAEAARAVFEYRAEQTAKTKLAQRAKKEAEAKNAAMGMSDVADAGAAANAAPPEEKAAAKQPQLPAQIIQNEAKVRFDAAVDAQIGFAERLVWFWSNHFCISADKIGSMAGAYEREAIRPHVLGRFADLLTAAESHPAMLFYLDNVEVDGGEFRRRHQSRQGAQRESRPRDSRAAHARRPQRLFAGRRDELCQRAHRLDLDRPSRADAWRRVRLHQAPA